MQDSSYCRNGVSRGWAKTRFAIFQDSLELPLQSRVMRCSKKSIMGAFPFIMPPLQTYQLHTSSQKQVTNCLPFSLRSLTFHLSVSLFLSDTLLRLLFPFCHSSPTIPSSPQISSMMRKWDTHTHNLPISFKNSADKINMQINHFSAFTFSAPRLVLTWSYRGHRPYYP